MDLQRTVDNLDLAPEIDTGKDALMAILEYAREAEDEAIPGLDAALRCILHINTTDAGYLIDEIRLDRSRDRLAQWLINETVYRIDFSGSHNAVGPFTNPAFIECRDATDAAAEARRLASETRIGRSVVNVRRAEPIPADLDILMTQDPNFR